MALKVIIISNLLVVGKNIVEKCCREDWEDLGSLGTFNWPELVPSESNIRELTTFIRNISYLD